MKAIIALLLILGFAETVMAQDHRTGALLEKPIIDKAVEDMANSLFPTTGDNQLLVIQVKRQINKALNENPSQTTEEVIETLIKKTQRDNLDGAVNTAKAYARLTECEELLGKEETKNSFYSDNYLKNGVDDIQEGLAEKTKQLTAEVYANASMIGKYTEFVIKRGNCRQQIKEGLQKGKKCFARENQNNLDELPNDYNPAQDNTRVNKTVISE